MINVIIRQFYYHNDAIVTVNASRYAVVDVNDIIKQLLKMSRGHGLEVRLP